MLRKRERGEEMPAIYSQITSIHYFCLLLHSTVYITYAESTCLHFKWPQKIGNLNYGPGKKSFLIRRAHFSCPLFLSLAKSSWEMFPNIHTHTCRRSFTLELELCVAIASQFGRKCSNICASRSLARSTEPGSYNCHLKGLIFWPRCEKKSD